LNKPGEEKERFLISVSSDRMIKIWDLDTQHCQVSNIHHKAQINTMVLMSDLVICASDDATLRFFKITWQNDEEKRFEDGAELQLEYFGSTNRNATDKTTFLTVSKNLLVAHGLKNVIDIWKFNDAAEVRKRQKKRVKKAKRKMEAADEENSSEIIINEEETIEDRLGQNISHKSGGKLRGLSMIHSSPQEVKIVAQHTSNQLQIHSLRSDAMLVENLGKLTLAGHRDSPLAVTFSSDNRAILTGSNDCVKVWAVETCKPVRTVETEHVTTLAYVRGDRQALIGTKTGKLLLVDIASADILEEKEAHEGEIWQIKSSKQ
jgi:U3 small nucleolar RNA-associated protein 12